eukprot:m.12758 g.12758  ORF g.12758 m.12758 type:complete len:140 (+) comp7318_c0_seq3:974-1393(+)
MVMCDDDNKHSKSTKKLIAHVLSKELSSIVIIVCFLERFQILCFTGKIKLTNHQHWGKMCNFSTQPKEREEKHKGNNCEQTRKLVSTSMKPFSYSFYFPFFIGYFIMMVLCEGYNYKLNYKKQIKMQSTQLFRKTPSRL